MSDKTLYTVTIFSENIVGLLNQITIIFTRRQLNIETLSVSPSALQGIHKFTITTFSDESTIDKIVKQIDKRVDILKAFYNTDEDLVFQEIALYKLSTELFLKMGSVEELIRKHNARILEINEAARLVQESTDSEANIIFGAGIDNTLKDEIHITVIATGFEKSAFPTREPKKKPFKASVPYGSATAAMNPYENRASLEKQEIPAFEAPNVQNFYDSQEASYFPGANRPAPQMPPVAGVPQLQTGASVFQQPYPQVQQVPQYQSAQQPAYSPYQQQQPQQSDKDDLGVPAYLRRSVKK